MKHKSEEKIHDVPWNEKKIDRKQERIRNLMNRVGSSSLFVITTLEREERKHRAQAIFEDVVNMPKLRKISSHILRKYLIPIRIKLYTYIYTHTDMYSFILSCVCVCIYDRKAQLST